MHDVGQVQSIAVDRNIDRAELALFTKRAKEPVISVVDENLLALRVPTLPP